MIFRNKSWFYSILMLFISLLGVGIIYVVMISTMGLINGPSVFLFIIAIALTILSAYYFIITLIRYALSDTYLKIRNSGIELRFLNFFGKFEYYNFSWGEINSIEERIGRRIYKLVIVPQNKKVIKIPPELYLNYFRVNKIEKALSDKPIKLTRNGIAKIYLVLGDISVFIVTAIFVAMGATILHQWF